MSVRIWERFKFSFSVYICVGIIVSFLNAINIFYFQKLLDGFGRRIAIVNLVIYGLTIIIVPIISYLEQSPKMKLQNGIFFYLKETALTKISKISYLEYLKLGSGSLLQKVEAGSSAGRNIHLNFYGRLFRELLPETFFNLFFIAIIDVKLIPAILIGYIFIFIITKYLLKILQAIKERSLISEEVMNNILIRGITEMVTFRINKRYKKEISNYHEMAASTTNTLTKMTMIHEFFFAFFAFLVAAIKLVIVILSFTNILTVSLGGLVALVTYIDRVYTPIAIFNVIYFQCDLCSI
jgi:ATP-binding cassette subfamily B protein